MALSGTTERVVRHWNKLPKEVAMAPSVWVIEKDLENPQRQMGQILISYLLK